MVMVCECPKCAKELQIDPDTAPAEIACPHCGQSLKVPGAPLPPGAELGGFRVERLIGTGSMGRVYLATQLTMNRPVALKVLLPKFASDPEFHERFLLEVRNLAKLDHPSIVRAIATGEHEGLMYYAMSYVDGKSLEERLTAGGPLGEREALRVGRQIAEALGYAWRHQQLLHRDIKPANIMVDQNGNAILMDLGISKSLKSNPGLTIANESLGTPYYMSPEQARAGQLDQRSDIYSLGATLYHVLVGQHAFEGASAYEVIGKHLNDPLVPPRKRRSDLSVPCSHLIEMMMAKDREQRPADWETLVVEIDRVLEGEAPVEAKGGKGGNGAHKGQAPARHLTTTPAGASRRAAQVAMASRRASSVPVGFILLVCLLLFALLIVLVMAKRAPDAAPVVYTPPVTPATRPTPAPRPVKPAGQDRFREQLEKEFEEIKAQAATSQEYDVILERYRSLLGRGGGARLETLIRQEIHEVEPHAAAAVDDVMKQLNALAGPFLAKGEFAKAAAVYRDYAGPFARLSLDRRQAKVTEINAKIEDLDQKRRGDQQAHRQALTALDQLAVELAPQLLAGQLEAVRQRAIAAEKNPALAPARAEVEALADLLTALVGTDQVIRDSLVADADKELVYLLKSGKQTLVVKDVVGKEVRALQSVKSGHVGYKFGLDELSPTERFKRLGKDDRPELHLARGLVAAEAGKKDVAKECLALLDSPIARALTALLMMPDKKEPRPAPKDDEADQTITKVPAGGDDEGERQTPGESTAKLEDFSIGVSTNRNDVLSGVDYDNRLETLNVEVKITNKATNRDYQQLDATVCVFGESVVRKGIFLLYGRENFTFDLPRRETKVLNLPRMDNEYDDNRENRFGFTYRGYIVILKDAEKKTITVKTNKGVFVNIADRLTKRDPGSVFDKRGEAPDWRPPYADRDEDDSDGGGGGGGGGRGGRGGGGGGG